MIRFRDDTGVGLIPVRRSRRRSTGEADLEGGGGYSSVNINVGGMRKENVEIVRRVEIWQTRRVGKMSDVALAGVNKRVTSPIVGFSSLAQLEEMLEDGGKPLMHMRSNTSKNPTLPDHCIFERTPRHAQDVPRAARSHGSGLLRIMSRDIRRTN
jgi:hypothetical protein